MHLSACIISFQEQDRIEACLDSLDFCDEIVVVDSHSTDATREIARRSGARVIRRDWSGHVAQKEYAVRQASYDWVLCVDCDERVGPALKKEILLLKKRGFQDKAGWSMPRLSRYLGRWIRHGWYPDRQLRLFDRRRGHWSGHNPHDRVELEGPVGTLNGDLLHHPYRDLSDHLRTIERYTTTMARGMDERGRRAYPWNLLFNPVIRFLKMYIYRGAVLEGWQGLVLSCLSAHYVGLKYAKLMVMQQEDRG
jgi:glycosyltransferase involved in cell wall biosynthesis